MEGWMDGWMDGQHLGGALSETVWAVTASVARGTSYCVLTMARLLPPALPACHLPAGLPR